MSEEFDQWGILELMGHVRLAGRITEESHFGAALGRIDIPNGDGFTTQYFGGNSIYRLTPTTEQVARMVAAHNQPEPVSRWELPLAAMPPAMDRRAATPYDLDWTSPLDEEIEEDDDDDDEELDEDAEAAEREHELSKDPL